MTFKKWRFGTPDKDLAKEMAAELNIDPFSAMLAQIRGINDVTELDYFISDELQISSADELIDIQKAADIINEYIDSGLKIAIFGDYDCDGICASAILYKYLKKRGADVFVYIPDRITEGYGMNRTAIDVINENDCKLIITVDNGISCKDEIDYAASLGIVTVVTDHHLPPDILPDAAAVVDPNRNDCPSSFKQICGAAVVFKVICKTDNKEPEELIDDYADLVAVATVGDSMPLIKENRSLVKYGIKRIKSNSSVALSAVLSVAGIDRSALDSGKLSYGIVPRINAAGRMGDAMRAFELLICDDMIKALKFANEIEDENARRQKTEREIAESVIKAVEANKYNYDRVIVVSGKDYHIGVLGISAAKICEKYGKPTIILSTDGTVSVGSCRSVDGFNIYNALKHCEDLLIKYGGHTMAAGLTIKEENVDLFRERINSFAADSEQSFPTIYLDFKLNPASISPEMVYAIKLLEPFGNENPSPLFGITGANIKRVSELSNGKHLKLFLEKSGHSFSGILFNTSADRFAFEVGDTIDLAVILDLNTYMNNTAVSVIIRGIRPSGIDEDKVLSDLAAIDNFYARGIINRDRLSVSRNDIALIYKYISNNITTRDKVVYRFLNETGACKTVIIIDILRELKLISFDGDKIFTNNIGKTDLSLSKTYNTLTKDGDKDDR